MGGIHIANPTVLTFLVLTCLVAVLTYFKSKETDKDSGKGYFMADRSLSGIVIAVSIIMTDLSAVQLIGNNGQSVRVGIGVFATQGLGCTGLMITAIFLMPKYLKAGISTIPDLYSLRFDKFTRTLLMGIMILNYTVIMIPTALYAGAQVFLTIFDIRKYLKLSEFQTIFVIIVAISIIGTVYTVLGGLKAIAISDTIYGIGMMIGGCLVTYFGIRFLSQSGGFLDGLEKFVTTDPAMLNAWNEAGSNEPWWPWPVLFTGLTVMNVQYFGCDQAMMQRAFGAKSLEHAQKGLLYAGLLSLLTPVFLVIPGIIANFSFPGTDWVTQGDAAFPMLIAACLPKSILGFFAACVFGAVLSTYDSMLNSASTIFAYNIYKENINPDASEQKVVKVGKTCGIIVAVVATVISPLLIFAQGLSTWLLTALGIFNCPILVLTLVALYSKWAPKNIAKVMVPVHIVLYVMLCYILPKFIGFFGKVHYLYWTFVLFFVDLGVVWIMTKKNPLKEEFELPHNPPENMDMTPWKHRKFAVLLTLLIILMIYVIFSPLSLGKSDKTTWERYQESVTRSVQ